LFDSLFYKHLAATRLSQVYRPAHQRLSCNDVTCPTLRRASDTIALIKLALWRRLLGSHVAGFDLCSRVVLAFDWRSGNSPQHSQLPHVGKGVRNRALNRRSQRADKSASEARKSSELLQPLREAINFLIPFSG